MLLRKFQNAHTIALLEKRTCNRLSLKRSVARSFCSPTVNTETSNTFSPTNNSTNWDDPITQQNFLNYAKTKLNIKNTEDWYRVSRKNISELVGPKIWDSFKFFQILSSHYPTHTWEPWKFTQVPDHFWKDSNNQRNFIEYVSKQLQIKDMKDWYREIIELGGHTLLKMYGGSLYNLLASVYPKYDWLAWEFERSPVNYWEDVNNQKRFLENVKEKFQIKEMSDWYKVLIKDIQRVGGYSLIERHNHSMANLLSTVYPEYDWIPWKFEYVPKGYWDDNENQRKFIESFSKEMNLKNLEDWYKVTISDFKHFGASQLLAKYNYSPHRFVAAMFPQHEWLPWKFDKCPQNYWDSMENQRKFMDWAGKQLGVKELSDWYKVSQISLLQTRGRSLINRHGNSLSHLLSQVYPEYEWLPWKFERAPIHMWTEKTAKKFLDWAGKQLGVVELSDWKAVTSKQLAELGLSPTQSIPELLSMAYPDHNFANMKLKSAHFKKSQTVLKSALQALFPKEEILQEYRHSDIMAPSTGHALELDFFYPQYNLAFEYQGKQHYQNIGKFHRFADSLTETKLRDMQKVSLCKSNGITLIEVPYWWDKQIPSLAATVYAQRPDLFVEKPAGEPIPSSPRAEYQEQATKSPRSALMNATVWEPRMDPTGWLMTEKYDGMRLYWTGSQFLTRQGKKVTVPEGIKKQLPSVALDGELWTQYGLHQEAVSIVMNNKQQSEERWNKAVFWVFDIPSMPFQPYEDRMEALRGLKDKGSLPEFVKIVETVECKGQEHLKEYLNSIIEKGGEGVMLREPQSVYKAGRSPSLRKYKAFFDTEVKVNENNYPHGFNCVQMNGKPLFVALKDNLAEAKGIKEGAVITVKYLGVNAYGTLQYPQFYRERLDVKWEDLINA